MNSITNELPERLDAELMDIAQAYGGIDYNDIMALGKAWPSMTDAERARIEGLSGQLAGSDGGLDDGTLAGQLASAVKSAGRIELPDEDPGFHEGELVLYQNGSRFELGLIKRVTESAAFVYYSEGDTAAKTPWDCLHKITNNFAVRSVTLGGAETVLENGLAKKQEGA